MHRHGGPFDRGSADFYYGREFRPHYYMEKSYQSARIDMYAMTAEQIQEYKAGWDDARVNGEQKDWD